MLETLILSAKALLIALAACFLLGAAVGSYCTFRVMRAVRIPYWRRTGDGGAR